VRERNKKKGGNIYKPGHQRKEKCRSGYGTKKCLDTINAMVKGGRKRVVGQPKEKGGVFGGAKKSYAPQVRNVNGLVRGGKARSKRNPP